ncbi:hypothetical protein PU630_05100 [Microbacterium horticulturae]|uniref:RNA polymerase sigma-70 factor, ECF subfamily n=1 Tax=Microbacterium horticulturae TaxID=3028316 RepID=A0ABY8C0Y6_9MICO|nr:hypothetical protein [Microbacterium sp. KACC 23027]WEG09935.1 hypothetical protein PU630_05100 [Microbacterium sp. KACC 23027]
MSSFFHSLVSLTRPTGVRDHIVAIGFRDGPEAGLSQLQPLLAEPALATYHYLSAARADFLRQLHRWSEAAAAYDEALSLTDNDVERAFLTDRLNRVRRHLG